MAVKYFCDSCEKEVEDKKIKNIRWGERDYRNPFLPNFAEVCEECLEKVVTLLGVKEAEDGK